MSSASAAQKNKGMFHAASLDGVGVIADLLLSAGHFHLPGDTEPRQCVWPYLSLPDGCCEAVPHKHVLFERL